MDLETKIFCGYLLAVNVLSILFFGFDKRRAIHQGRRIPEKQLWLLGLLGGFLGGFLAMRLFRHTRRKLSFLSVYVVLSILSALVLYWVGGNVLGLWPAV